MKRDLSKPLAPTFGNPIKKRKAAKEAKKVLASRESKMRADRANPSNKPKLTTLKVKSSKLGERVQAKESIAEKVTSGPKLIKYYQSQGMSLKQATAKMVRAKTGKS